MKLAISGKGGVGKTTVAALLCRIMAERGKKVVAIDADPDANLAGAIGINPEEAERIKPITDMPELIEERTGVRPGSGDTFFKLNPRVDDLPDLYGKEFEGIKILTLGHYKQGGAGCYCAENVMIKSLINHLLLRSNEALVIDMEAGIEHLSRGTAASVDAMIVVVEPGSRSIDTAKRIKKLTSDLGIRYYFIVANKIRSSEDREYINDSFEVGQIIGCLPYSDEIAHADQESRSPYRTSSQITEEISCILDALEGTLRRNGS
ncbi:MAG: AAA family ATPase [bacterium]